MIWEGLRPRRLWICVPNIRLWCGCYHGDCGCLTPGEGTGKGITLETLEVGSQIQSLGREFFRSLWKCYVRKRACSGYPGDYVHVTHNTNTEIGGHPGDWRNVTTGADSEDGVTLETVDM